MSHGRRALTALSIGKTQRQNRGLVSGAQSAEQVQGGQSRGRHAGWRAVGGGGEPAGLAGCVSVPGPSVVNQRRAEAGAPRFRPVVSTAPSGCSVGMGQSRHHGMRRPLQAAVANPSVADGRRNGVMAADTLAGKHPLCPAWAWAPPDCSLHSESLSASVRRKEGDSLDPGLQKEVNAKGGHVPETPLEPKGRQPRGDVESQRTPQGVGSWGGGSSPGCTLAPQTRDSRLLDGRGVRGRGRGRETSQQTGCPVETGWDH